jgi:hypothetical protein
MKNGYYVQRYGRVAGFEPAASCPELSVQAGKSTDRRRFGTSDAFTRDTIADLTASDHACQWLLPFRCQAGYDAARVAPAAGMRRYAARIGTG